MWLKHSYIRLLHKHLYITMYLAHMGDHFPFMLTFLTIYSSIYVWPRSHKTQPGSSWGYYNAVTTTCQHNWPKLKQANKAKTNHKISSINFLKTQTTKGDWAISLATNNTQSKQLLKMSPGT